MDADYWIKRLEMTAHPEGGYFAEVYRNSKTGETAKGTRNLSTSIYFLLEGENKSHFHQLSSDELWYYHAGSPVIVHMLSEKGYSKSILGVEEGQQPQLIIQAGVIFAAQLMDSGGYGLLSCMVSPGFDFEDFKLFESGELISRFPAHEKLIREFTIK